MEEFIQEFKEESINIIERVQQALLSVNLKADNKELIEEIFRGVHTLKGSSRMFGFEQIEKLTHDLETKFDQIRDGEIILDRTLIDLALKVLDTVRIIIDGNEGEDQISDISDEMNNYHQNDIVKPIEYYQLFYSPKANIYERGINPKTILDEVTKLGATTTFTLFQNNSLEEMEKNKCFEAAYEIYLATSVQREEIEDVFLFLDDSEYSMYLLIEGELPAEKIIERAAKYLKKGKRLSKKGKEERLTIIQGFFRASKAAKKQPETELKSVNKKAVERQVESSSLNYINVKIDRLDEMMRLVSELVTLKAQFFYQAQVIDDTSLSNSVDQLEKLSNKFRDIAFNMRLVPLQILSLKFQRSIHDLGESLNKEINFITQGLETEFDKSIINEIEGPLLHIIRNAIDHGLESPDDREKLGKSRKGLLKISAFYEGANVFIQIQDDGRGLNLDKIKNTAISKNLIQSSDQLTDQEVMKLIFHSGFSTNSSTTKFSGRGVGMDVVMNKLKELRGSISITTEKGLGTTFTLRLPLSLSILDVLHVKVGSVNYLIPQHEIIQCFSERLNKDQIKRSGLNMNFNNNLIPHLQLDRILEEKNISGLEPSVIVIQKNDETLSIEVHDIIGEDQLVIKPVDEALKKLSYLSGIAVLGNGELAFLLDSFRLRNSLTEFGINENSTVHGR